MQDSIYDNHDAPSAFVKEMLDKAARASFGILRKYYSSTDQSVYAIALAMDPTCKYQWWDDACWPADWVMEAKEQVQDAWDKWKHKHPAEAFIERQDTIPDQQQQQKLPHRPLKLRKRMHPEKAPADELTRYIGEDTIEEFSETVSSYWIRQGPTRARLASFAKGFLCVPATSTPSERCFSRAKFYMPPSRNRLSDENISMSILLDSFMKYRDNT